VQVLALLVGVFTARMLTPADFGVIACLAIFLALSNVFIDSGFTTALVRREKNTNSEYSAVFIFNIVLSVALYLVLYFSAEKIANHFRLPQLVSLSRFLFIALIINSFGIIQNVIFTKELKFKEISIANILSAIASLCVTVILVLRGYTYWAIAWQQMTLVAVKVLFFWIFSTWRPFHKPKFSVLKELFSFSAFLIFTNFINIFVKYIYNLKIPVKFSKETLGFYDRASKFQQIPETVVSGAINSVAYPIVASLNNEPQKQLQFFRKMVRVNAFLIFPIMFGLIGIIENLTIIVLTDKWLPMIPYFKILCAAALTAPFRSLCLNTLNAIGKPKHYFALELIRNFLTIVLFIFFSNTVEQMLWGFTISMFAAYISNILAVGHFIKYSVSNHLRDILPYAAISAVMCIIVTLLSKINLNIYLVFSIQAVAGVVFYISVAYLLGSQVIKDVVELFKKKK
jgi:O-antigen/teichoic acid export membrane protein